MTTYLLIHLVSLIVFVASLSIVLTHPSKSKIANISLGISGLSLFISGFGMLHRGGYSMHALWVSLKLLIWVIVAGLSPVVAKRFPKYKYPFFILALVLLSVSIFLAIYKPMLV